MKSSFFVLFTIVSLNCFTQNLVPNPSFEDTIACPLYIGEFNVLSWYSPNGASPDLFHSCSDGNSGAPQNAFGWQMARTGEAYVGGHASSFQGSNVREYIQCQLTSALILGENYVVSFFVSRADSSTKACDNLGVFFSESPVTKTGATYLNQIPQIVSPPGEPIINDTEWVQIIDTITATMNFEYMTIGIFTDDMNTDWITVPGGWEEEAHYFIDDVSVTQLSSNVITDTKQSQVSIFPNPTSGVFSVSSDYPIQSYRLFSNDGRIIRTEKLNGTTSIAFKINLSEFPQGIYIIELKSEYTSTIKQVLISK